MTVIVAANMLVPAAALVLWSMVMLIWAGYTRFPAMKDAQIDINKLVGARGHQLDGKIPDKANWPSHNYTHLMEQPTVFYPTVIILAVLGEGDSFNVAVAWAYVFLRIVHSLWQVTVNTVPVRLKIFLASTMLLLVLAFRALVAALSG